MFNQSRVVTGTAAQKNAGAQEPRVLVACLRRGELSRTATAWDFFQAEGGLDFSGSIDRFATSALEMTTLGAVIALFVAALV